MVPKLPHPNIHLSSITPLRALRPSLRQGASAGEAPTSRAALRPETQSHQGSPPRPLCSLPLRAPGRAQGSLFPHTLRLHRAIALLLSEAFAAPFNLNHQVEMLGVGCKSGPSCPPRKGLLFRNVSKTSGCLEVGVGGGKEREDDQTEVLLRWEDLFGDVDVRLAGCCLAPPSRVTAVSGNSTPPGPPSASWFRKSAERAECGGRPGSSFRRQAEWIQGPGKSEALCSLFDSHASGLRRSAEPGRRSAERARAASALRGPARAQRVGAGLRGGGARRARAPCRGAGNRARRGTKAGVEATAEAAKGKRKPRRGRAGPG